MSSVFLFGAGASFGSEKCHPEPPPLGDKLFAKLKERGGIADSVTSSLDSLFQEDFEKGMAEFHRTREAELPTFLREMALYFAGFQALEGNLYMDLVRHIAATKQKVVIATTNYELLIEHSIIQAGYGVEYGTRPLSRDRFCVLKIHGSCNFLPNLPASFVNCNFLGPAPSVEGPIRFAQPYEVEEFCSNETSLAPAIAIYARGKQVKFCPDVVQYHQKCWREAVSKAKRIFLVGLRVNAEDSHIWQVLASSKAQLLYVGGPQQDFEDWKKETGRKNAHWIKSHFNEAMPIIKNHLN